MPDGVGLFNVDYKSHGTHTNQQIGKHCRLEIDIDLACSKVKMPVIGYTLPLSKKDRHYFGLHSCKQVDIGLVLGQS